MYLMISSFFGLCCVIFGAYLEHGLKNQLSIKQFNTLEIALNYQQFHTLALVAIALVFLTNPNFKKKLMLRLSALGFCFGIVLFSFSLYFSVLLDFEAIKKIAPVGGFVLMLSWILLFFEGLKSYKNTKN